MYMVYVDIETDNKTKSISQPFRDIFEIMRRFKLSKDDIIDATTRDDDPTIELGCYRIRKVVEIDGEYKVLYIDICVVTPEQELDIYQYLQPEPIGLKELYQQITNQ